MANFPANLADLQALAADHMNDLDHTRYKLDEINEHLDIAQDRWNREAHICRVRDTLTTVTDQYQYSFSLLSATPLEFWRVTHKNIDLIKRSREYFDRYSGVDWTQDKGTPKEFGVDLGVMPAFLFLHPTPTGNDAGANLIAEYTARHDKMVNPTDTPFTVNGVQNTLIIPYIAGLAIEAAADILQHDPTPETVKKVASFKQESEAILSQVIQWYSRLDADEPLRMAGGRNWFY